MTRTLRTVAAALMLLLSAAAPAMAHSNTVSTSPEEGAILDVLPASVTITLDEKPMDVGHALAVTAPDGTLVSTGAPELRGHQLIVPVKPGGPAGEYVIGYRVVSADGHVVNGSARFTVTSGPPIEGAVTEIYTNDDQNSVSLVFAAFSITGMIAFVTVAIFLLRRHNRNA